MEVDNQSSDRWCNADNISFIPGQNYEQIFGISNQKQNVTAFYFLKRFVKNVGCLINFTKEARILKYSGPFRCF